MFYCGACAENKGWPSTAMKSEGKCELCKKNAVCNDLPSWLLPASK